ncbi:MAG: hypothetical protein IT289_04285 [Oligoflexia bacterium]|nr:hypothetical protein [Oligoflexia bacterium]
MKGILVLGLVLASSVTALAEDWLQSLSESQPQIKTEVKTLETDSQRAKRAARREPNLKDPFIRFFFVQMESNPQLPFEVRQWADAVMGEEFERASHLWSVVSPLVPEHLRHLAQSAQLYSLFKQDLTQTFVAEWLKAQYEKSYFESPAEAALENAIFPSVLDKIGQQKVALSEQERDWVFKISGDRPLWVWLRGWSALRNPELAEGLLEKIPKESTLKSKLSQTVAVKYLKQNDFSKVAKVLKLHYEPAVMATKSEKEIAGHFLNIARVLYQAGQLQGALAYYEKIPKSSAHYLKAKEESLWVLLRLGRLSQLRGELKSFDYSFFKSRFLPEVSLVRSISNLKLCLYGDVEKDFEEFKKLNSSWAVRIDNALNAPDTPVPPESDYFTQSAETQVQNLSSEIQQIQGLAHKSIEAALPAVGVQKHWTDYKETLVSRLEGAKKRLADERRRQWKNARKELGEAIKKMRFVKLEYMNQVRTLSQRSQTTTQVAGTNNVLPQEMVSKDKLVFPHGIDFWPDELFKLRSTAQSVCLKQGGGQ